MFGLFPALRRLPWSCCIGSVERAVTPIAAFARSIGPVVTKLRPAPGLGASIVELAGNLPYDVQRLAHETWDELRADAQARA